MANPRRRQPSLPKVHIRQATDLPINSRVAVAIVDDPYAPGEKIATIRSTRDDPLADMHSRGAIDDAKYLAGRKWQRLHELTAIGPISAIDTTKEPVDGGGAYPDPINDAMQDAFRELAEADKRLGAWGSILVRNLLAEGMTVGQMCERHSCVTGRQQSFLSMRVRECLEDLAVLWGYVGGRRNRI